MHNTISKLGRYFFLLSLLVVFSASCTKKQENRLTNQEQETLKFTKAPTHYDGKVYELRTLKRLESVSNVIDSHADELVLDDDLDQKSGAYARFPLVNYTGSQELLEILGTNFPIMARENSTYKVITELDDRFLRIYLVAPKTEISFLLQPSAEPVKGTNEYKVQLTGVPVLYYKIQEAVDAFGEKTGKTELVTTRYKSQAERMRVLYGENTNATFLNKIDVFPRDLFKGDWYYSETVVSANDSLSGALGGSFSLGDTRLASSTKVRFFETDDKIRAVNINIDEKVNADDEVNFQTVLEIPVVWLDYRVRKNGEIVGFEEEAVFDKHWKDRKYAFFNIEQVRSSLLENQVSTAVNNRKFVDIHLGADYISYTIFLPELGFRVRHSFARAKPRPYKPRLAHKEDMKKFGMFTTYKKVLSSFRIHRPEDIEKNRFMNRFDTSSGKIYFHFTSNSPLEYRPMGQKAVDEWNETFDKAGTGVEIVLCVAKDKPVGCPVGDVKLGDIRYNAINLIRSVSSEGGALGFGPSLTDPQTGEIISATSNVWVTNLEEGVISFIRNYVRSELGLLDKKYGFSEKPGANSPSLDLAANIIKGSLAQENLHMTPVKTLEEYKRAPETFNLEARYKERELRLDAAYNKALKEAKKTHGRMAEHIIETLPNFGREFSLGITHGHLIEDLKKKCPDVMAYVDLIKEENDEIREKFKSLTPNEIQKKLLTHITDLEHDALKTCAVEITKQKGLGTLVHELGHNFGLRHNFKGSTDKANFWSPEETGTTTVVDSSSTMEYPAFGADRLTKPGKYDIAAIAFSYGGTVELATGEVVQLDTTKDIDANLNGAERKPYAFCTDEHSARYAGAWWAQYTDPMCNQWDRGTTAEDVLDFMAAEYSTSVATQNYRLDKAWRAQNLNGLALGIRRNGSYQFMAKLFYDKWRMHLADFVGLGDEYLEKMDNQAYFSTLQAMSQSPVYKDVFAEYQPASQKAFSLLMDASYMPNSYCVTKNADGEYHAVELEEIRQQVYHTTRVSVTSCKDKEAIAFMKKDYGDLAFAIGHSTVDQRLDLSDEGLIESLDVLGTESDRYFAFQTLAMRAPLSLTHRAKNFMPNFYDEPIYRDQIIGTTMNRVLQGVSASDLRQDVIRNDFLDRATAEQAKMTPAEVEAMVDEAIKAFFASQGASPEAQNAELLKMKSNKEQYAAVTKQILDGTKEQLVQAQLQGTTFVKFKHENNSGLIPEVLGKGLVALMFEGLQQGLMIPGKQNINSQRANMFSAGTTDNPEVIQSAAASINIGGGRAIVVTQDNIVKSLIDRYKQVGGMSSLTEVTAEQEKKILEDTVADSKVTLGLKALIPEKSFTMQEHFDFVDSLNKTVEQLKSPAMKAQIQQVFSLEVQVVNYLKSKNLGEAELAALMAKDSIEAYAELSVEVGQDVQFRLTQANFKPLFDSMSDEAALKANVKASIDAQNKQAKTYALNKSDYEAQSDLLIGLIFGLAR